MPIPSPADFRNKTKKHSEMREMLAEMADGVTKIGDASISGNLLSNINYVTETRTLEFKNTINVITPNDRILLTTPQSLVLSSNSTYRIEYVVATNTLQAVAQNAARTLGNLVIGFVTASDTGLQTSDFMFSVNGLVPRNTNTLVKAFGNLSGLNFKVSDATPKLTVTGTVRLLGAQLDYTLPTGDFNLPTSNGTYQIAYSLASNVISFHLTSQFLSKDYLVFGFIDVQSGAYTIYGLDKYQINGALPKYKQDSFGVFSGDANGLNFDFANNKLIIAASTIRVLYESFTVLLPAQEVALDASSLWKRIVYSPSLNSVSIKNTSLPLTGDEVQVGKLNINKKIVEGIDNYYVNGQPVSTGASDLKTSELIIVNGDTDASYEQPILQSWSTWVTSNNTNHTAIYDLYDALMGSYPDYITKTLLGNDGLGNPIYRYDFKPSPVETVSMSGDVAKMILISGVHGFERSGIICLYESMRQICENWQTDSKLETLRWNTHFIVVPCVVPSGFDLNSRKNHNGIDIARQFPTNWAYYPPESTTPSGNAPLQELEAQYINTLLTENTDAIYFTSHHNFFDESQGFIWNCSGTKFGVRLAKSMISRLTRSWKKRYPSIMPVNGEYVGYADTNTPPGSEGAHATALGIQGGTFETCWRLKWDVDQSTYTSNVITLGTETFLNWLLLNLEYGSQLYNSKVNL